MTKCICSIIINGTEEIDIPNTENPGKAKSFNIKRRRCIFYDDDSGKYSIKKNSRKLSFPEYEKHEYSIYYGEPFFA